MSLGYYSLQPINIQSFNHNSIINSVYGSNNLSDLLLSDLRRISFLSHSVFSWLSSVRRKLERGYRSIGTTGLVVVVRAWASSLCGGCASLLELGSTSFGELLLLGAERGRVCPVVGEVAWRHGRLKKSGERLGVDFGSKSGEIWWMATASVMAPTMGIEFISLVRMTSLHLHIHYRIRGHFPAFFSTWGHFPPFALRVFLY